MMSDLPWFAWAAVGLLVWIALGCAVLALIDDEDRLFKWAIECPILFGYELMLLIWPIVVWYFYPVLRRK